MQIEGEIAAEAIEEDEWKLGDDPMPADVLRGSVESAEAYLKLLGNPLADPGKMVICQALVQVARRNPAREGGQRVRRVLRDALGASYLSGYSVRENVKILAGIAGLTRDELRDAKKALKAAEAKFESGPEYESRLLRDLKGVLNRLAGLDQAADFNESLPELEAKLTDQTIKIDELAEAVEHPPHLLRETREALQQMSGIQDGSLEACLAAIEAQLGDYRKIMSTLASSLGLKSQG